MQSSKSYDVFTTYLPHTPNNQEPQTAYRNRTFWVDLFGHEREDGLGVLVGLSLAGSTRVLSVVRQLSGAAQITDRVTEIYEHSVSGWNCVHFCEISVYLRYIHISL